MAVGGISTLFCRQAYTVKSATTEQNHQRG